MTPIEPLAQIAPPPPWRTIEEVFRTQPHRWWLILLAKGNVMDEPPLRPPKALPNY
ncbi:hypothetical protein [Sphingomonas prati]|uniref:Uncharacterized protein n=1 Tax=Sphingomonas prati TaxID=1843237 RepID=A0A7W9BQ75_9SPHN|nr:hypothetical protein [Sphingomonas prati]MBB5727916.1 hypothetical protein [Sphingomonas prati]GGE81852.1 hypothetical protein GCM10011404_13090 [Sphingomonas prati]